MSATMTIYEVVPNVKYVGNDIMNMFKNFFNRSKKRDVEDIMAERYGYDLHDHTYDEWKEAYRDIVNHAFIDETTGEFIPKADIEDNLNEFGFRSLDMFDFSDYKGLSIRGKKIHPVLRQLKKLRELGVVKKHYFKPSGLYEYIPVKVAMLNERPAYRQGWFFKQKWLDSDMPLVICTSYDDLKKSLDRIIDVRRGDEAMNERGVEAYQYFLYAFKELTKQNPDKKYFVEISF